MINSREVRPIVLLGYMGSGKSTILPLLAKATSRKAIDLDAYIEEKFSISISQIFERYGDYFFRKIERESLQEVLELEDVIIALGGGAPCFYDSMKLINQKAFTVYLHVSEDVLIERLWNQREHRPLLASLNERQFGEFISKQMRERSIYYDKAELVIRNLGLEAAVSSILNAFKSSE